MSSPRREPGGLRAALARRDRIVGTFVTVPDPALAEMLAGAFDLLVIDLEHAPLTTADALRLAIAAQGAGAWIVARVPSARSEVLAQVLDAGLDGIVVAKIDDGAAAAAAAAALTYPPHGVRGFGPRRAGGYGREGDYHRVARDRIACIVQIETAAGLQAVADIAGTAGVDALLIGPSDLSFELGEPLQTFAPVMIDAIGATLAAADRAGLSCAFASNVAAERLPELLDRRCNVLVQSTDLRIYLAAADATAAATWAGLDALREPAGSD
jgi:2-keto-3-deoxy-L-rhamnonate aldolase RhmA